MIITGILHYISSFHLEVLGAGGAVWGFSEMIGLRNEENWLFWRYISSIVTFIFFIRWLLIIKYDLRTDTKFIIQNL